MTGEAADLSGRVAVVTGAASGLGRAEAIGLTVLHACGGELERSAAWAVARELLLPGLIALDERDREELLKGPAAPALHRRPGFPSNASVVGKTLPG